MTALVDASITTGARFAASIVFEDVTVRYGRRVALHAFSHTVQPGEWLCLIGPNGAGKSSALRAATGLVDHSGQITVGGLALAGSSPRHRATMVAAVPQLPVLPEDMTGFDYVLLGRTPYISYFGSESAGDHQLVSDLLARLDLGAFADRPLGTLSGGERQQLVIARALAQQAPVLLLDEPTSALDIGHQQQALELVDRLRREHGLTVVSAMHDLTLAGLYADRLALLDHGRMIVTGSAAEVLTPEILHEHYGVAVHVRTEDDGTVVVVPRRA